MRGEVSIVSNHAKPPRRLILAGIGVITCTGLSSIFLHVYLVFEGDYFLTDLAADVTGVCCVLGGAVVGVYCRLWCIIVATLVVPFVHWPARAIDRARFDRHLTDALPAYREAAVVALAESARRCPPRSEEPCDVTANIPVEHRQRAYRVTVRNGEVRFLFRKGSRRQLLYAPSLSGLPRSFEVLGGGMFVVRGHYG